MCVLNAAPNDDQMMLRVAFLREGIQRRERCIYVVDEAEIEPFLGRLEADGLDVRSAMASGALQIVTARETYLSNGRFDPDAMIALLTGMAETAARDGWTGLRGMGEMSWAMGSDVGTESLIQYEARLNDLGRAGGMRLLCNYDRRRFPSEFMRDVLRLHPHVVIGEHVHDNPYFEPASLAGDGVEADGRRVDWMIDQIQRRTQRATAVTELGAWALERVPPRELMQAAAHIIWRELAVSFVEVFSFPPTGDTAVRRAVAGLDSTAVTDLELELNEVWPSVAGSVRLDPLVVPDWTDAPTPAVRLDLAIHEVRSSAAIPICGRQVQPPFGVVWLHSAEPRIFTDDEMMFVKTIALMIGETITRTRAQEAFEMVVEHASDIIARFDEDLRFTYVNPAIEQLTGLPAASVIGSTSREAGLANPQADATELVLHLAWRTRREQTLEMELQTPLGRRHFLTRVLPELGPDGAVQSLLSIARDTTDQRQAEEERARLYPALLEQQRRLEELMSRLEEDRAREKEVIAGAVRAAQLTPRQLEVLRLMVRDWTNRQIAAELNVSTGTVKAQVARIMTAMGAAHRTDAAVRAVQLGVIPQD